MLDLMKLSRKVLSQRYIYWSYVSLGLMCSIGSIILVKLDINFTYRWIAFTLHIVSFLLLVGSSLWYANFTLFTSKRHMWKEILPLSFVLLVTLIISMYRLDTYPYVAIEDEIRDGGLNAVQIFTGEIQNIFDYGRYTAHGLIIPTFVSFFYPLFKNSVFLYRVPEAIVSCLEIVGMYILLRCLSTKKIAFLGALLLATLPLHIFFSRTEIVITFTSFWATMLLLVLYIHLYHKKTWSYILFGVTVGFSLNFHASVRTFAMAMVLLVVVYEIVLIVSHWMSQQTIKARIRRLFLSLLFIPIGFGPRILYTTPAVFFHTDRFFLSGSALQQDWFSSIGLLLGNYWKSLFVWIYEPTSARYAAHQPLLSVPIGALFILGIGYIIFVSRNKFLYFVALLAGLIPFTNSAITNMVNADYRLTPLLPIGTVLASVGFVFILSRYKNVYFRRSCIGIFSFLLLFQVVTFFTDQKVNAEKDIPRYLSMNMLTFLRTNPAYKSYSPINELVTNYQQNKVICVVVSASNYDTFSLLHYQEQRMFLYPKVNFILKRGIGLPDNNIYLFKDVCPAYYGSTKQTRDIFCLTGTEYMCPPKYRGLFSIHY